MKFEISAMLYPDTYDHLVHEIELIETHISWIVLTGKFAYKIKKPVNFGFLDFSTLQKRQFYCQQELHLNQRLTRNLYLDVVSITHQKNKLKVTAGEPIEYAIKMHQFPQSSQLDNMLTEGKLTTEQMSKIAQMVAHFHQQAAAAENLSNYGNMDAVGQPVMENFSQITALLQNTEHDNILGSIKLWSESSFKRLESKFTHRKQQGFIRECHGDMHLQNMLWLGDPSTIEPGKGPMAFDCIEFNENLRWIDVISEVAFLLMDLHNRKQQQLANRFLNDYLEITGDYGSLEILPFYLCYRAMVRAKIAVLSLQQPEISTLEKTRLCDEVKSHLKLASCYSQTKNPTLIIMLGVSASGKSSVSQQLLDKTGAIRIRSDIERKRLHDFNQDDDTANTVNNGIYTEKSSERTYARLFELTAAIMTAGYSVIVDATFLKQQQRAPFKALAEQLDAAYFIVETTAPEETLRRRITERKNDISDADLNVLDYQLSNRQPLPAEEEKFALSINTTGALDIDQIIELIT